MAFHPHDQHGWETLVYGKITQTGGKWGIDKSRRQPCLWTKFISKLWDLPTTSPSWQFLRQFQLACLVLELGDATPLFGWRQFLIRRLGAQLTGGAQQLQTSASLASVWRCGGRPTQHWRRVVITRFSWKIWKNCPDAMPCMWAFLPAKWIQMKDCMKNQTPSQLQMLLQTLRGKEGSPPVAVPAPVAQKRQPILQPIWLETQTSLETCQVIKSKSFLGSEHFALIVRLFKTHFR